MKPGVSPWAVRGLYFLALILAITPVTELVSTVWPPRPGDLVWRYGALGLAAAYMPNVTLGIALVLVMAYWRGHRFVMLAVGAASVLLAVGILPVMGLFALDMLQVRALRPPEQQSPVLIAGVIQEVKYLAVAIALLCLGIGGTKMGATSSARSEPRVGVLRSSGS